MLLGRPLKHGHTNNPAYVIDTFRREINYVDWK